MTVRIEATKRTVEERLDDMQKQMNMNKERVKDYTRENPLMALGIAFIAGYFIGKLMSK